MGRSRLLRQYLHKSNLSTLHDMPRLSLRVTVYYRTKHKKYMSGYFAQCATDTKCTSSKFFGRFWNVCNKCNSDGVWVCWPHNKWLLFSSKWKCLEAHAANWTSKKVSKWSRICTTSASHTGFGICSNTESDWSFWNIRGSHAWWNASASGLHWAYLHRASLACPPMKPAIFTWLLERSCSGVKWRRENQQQSWMSPQSNTQNVINATPNHLEINRSFEKIAKHKQKQDWGTLWPRAACQKKKI